MSEKKRINSSSRESTSGQSSANEWIEILEPKTKVQMFANLITGECRWDEPRGQGVVISRATNPSLTQWWELYDTNSQRFYYYCAKDSKTVWKRPQTPDAIVVPLAKLQILKQNTCSSHSSVDSTASTTRATTGDVRDDRLTTEVSTQTEPQLCSRSTQTQTTMSSPTNDYLFQNSFRNPSLNLFATPSVPIATSPTGSASGGGGGDQKLVTPPTKSHSLTQISSNLNRNCVQNNSNTSNSSKRLTTTTSLTTPSPTTPTTTTATKIMSANAQTLTLQTRPQTPPKSRQISHTLSLMPTTKTTAEKTKNVEDNSSTHLSIESFAKENIERHRKRGIFIGKKESELRGLRLMCACFWYFPPSHKLAPHMNAFLSSHANPYAAEVVRRKFEQQLRRSQQSHVVYVRKPHDRHEVSRVLRCVDNGFVGVFGETLDDALVDRRLIPWPIVSLTEALLRCRGTDENGDCCEREGVFRCVGDLDDVMRLKIKIDTVITRADVGDSLHALEVNPADIHVIASALKLYFRELKRPLVPHDVYWEALDSAHDPQRAQRLVERLPPTNRFALSYLIRFLQVFSAPEHVIHTKMDDANLSMVWAPNILRSEGGVALADASLSNIFERTRAEMSFVRTLIQNLDTGFMSGVQ
ncbi:unnamed protein product [Medioppia subpectinata]|uniref:Rho GTPase activating protein n=1 Tax=Medioppia subpectinata TaxID=1979941 RepID=A0A7R9KJZ6_9ACAR|nr:unnamed protein product [Medioppia subpectinata]CAG2103734.1 unnamed protein product [Medioppia subpectinata]